MKSEELIRKYGVFFQVLSGVGVPIVIGVVVFIAAQYVENRKVDADFIKIALGILSETSKGKETQAVRSDDNPQQKILRGWAVRLLNEKSPVKFTEDEQKALLDNGLPLIFDVSERSKRFAESIKAAREERDQWLMQWIDTNSFDDDMNKKPLSQNEK